MPPSSKISNGDLHTLDRFLKELDATSDTVKKLLNDVRASELDFAKIQIELSSLCKDVRELSGILRGGEKGLSLVTRVAILEENIKDIEKEIDYFEKQKEAADHEKHETYRASMKSISEIEIADKNGKWQMKTAIATGIIGLLVSAITVLVQIFK